MAGGRQPKTASSNKTSINVRWLNNALRSIGAAGADSIKSIAPNLFDTTMTGAKAAHSVAMTIRSSKSSLDQISSSLKNNRYVDMARRTVTRSLDDIKQGTLYNPDRGAEEMAEKQFGDLGGDWGDDEWGNDEDGSVTFNYFDEGDDGQSQSQTTEIVDAINQGTVANLKATKASMDSALALSSAQLMQSQQFLESISNQIGNMDNTLSAILEYHESNTSNFYESAMAAFEKIGNAVAPERDDFSYQDNSSPTDIFNSKGGLNFDKYKTLVKRQIKGAIQSNPIAGLLLPILEDDTMLEMLVSDPIGGITKGVIGGLLPKVVQGTLAEAEKTFSEFLPNVLGKFAKMANDPNTTGFKKFIAKMFGVSVTANQTLDLTDKVTKEAAVFDGVTRNAITEVLPKYARESTAYLREIAMHVTKKSSEDILSGAEFFDTRTTSYRTKDDITKSIGKDLQEAIVGAFSGTEFMTALQAAGSDLKTKEREKYERLMNQLMTQLAQEKVITVEDFDIKNENSGVRRALQNVEGKGEYKEAKKVLSSALRYMNENNIGVGSAALAQMKARDAWNEKIKDLGTNYDMYNVVGAGINEETDMFEFMDKQMGNTAAIKNREKAKEAAKREEEQMRREADRSSAKLKSANRIARDGIKAWKEGEDQDFERKYNQGTYNKVGKAVFGEDAGQGFKRAGDHFIASMQSVMHGDSRGAMQEFSAIFTDQIKTMWNGVQEHFFKPLGQKLFGEKDENGNRKNGLFAYTENKVKDTYKAFIQRVNGKDYTDSSGKTHTLEDPDNTLVGKATKLFTEVKEGIQYKLFGDPNKREEKKEKAKGIFGNFTESIRLGLQGWKTAIFGDEEEGEDTEKSVKKTSEKIKKQILDNMPDAIMGAAGGATLGTMAGGILGTAIGGPIGGAALGFASSFLFKSEKFKDYLFGPEIEDENGKRRIGGLISEKTQKFFKDNKKGLIGGAALGAVKGILFPSSAGMLTSIVGGPVAGAAIGMGWSLLKNSDTFNRFLFGDPDNGHRGVVQAFKDIFKKPGKEGESEDGEDKKDTLKKLGMAGLGAAGAAFGAGVIGKVGLFGALAMPGGPIGAAVAGAAIGIAASSKKFSKFLFGEKDKETGEKKKEGLFGKFGNYLHVEVIQPMKDKALNLIEDAKATLKFDILDNIRLPFVAAADSLKASINDFKDKAKEKGKDFLTTVVAPFTKPVIELVDNVVVQPMKKVMSKVSDVVYGVTKFAVKAPFVLLGKAARFAKSKINKLFGKAAGMIFGGIKGVFKLTTGLVGGLFKGAANIIGGGASFLNSGITKFKDKRASRKEGKATFSEKWNNFLGEVMGDDWQKDWHKTKAERSKAFRENKENRQNRAVLDYNRRQMARILGYDVKYFTEENMLAAEEAAKAQGKKLKWRGNKKADDFFETDPQVERAKLLKKPTAEIVSNGDTSPDIDVRMLSENHRQTEALEAIRKIMEEYGLDQKDAEEVYDEAMEQVRQDMADVGMDENGNINLDDEAPADKKKNQEENAELDDEEDHESIEDRLRNAVRDAGGFKNLVKGKIKGIGNDLFKSFQEAGQARAEGGDVEKDKAVLVGDGGTDPNAAEILVPETDGKVLSQKENGIRVFVEGFSSDAIGQIGTTDGEAAELLDGEGTVQNEAEAKGSYDTQQQEAAAEIEDTPTTAAATTADIVGQAGAAEKMDGESAQQNEAEFEGSYENQEAKQALLDEKEAQAKREEEQNAILADIRDNNEEHKKGFLDMFDKKKGLLALTLLALSPKLLELLGNIGSTIGTFLSNVAESAKWTEENDARTNGDSAQDRVDDNIEDAKEVGAELLDGDVVGAAQAFVLDEGEYDSGSGGRVQLLGNLGRHSVKFIDKALAVGNKVANIGRAAMGKDAKTAKTVGGMMKSVGTKLGGTKVGGAVKTATKTVADGAKAGAGKVIKLVKEGLESVVKRAVKRLPKAITGSKVMAGLKGILNAMGSCVKKHFPKIAGRITETVGGKTATHAATLGLDTLAFAAVGAINDGGKAGAARLFKINQESVDGTMQFISGCFGAIKAGTIVGSVIDIVSELMADILGVDLLHEVAVAIYNFFVSDEAYAELETAQAEFQDDYLDYQAAAIEDSYNKQKEEGVIDPNLSLEDYQAGLETGQYKAEYMSFQDWNADQNQTIGYKIGKNITKIGGAIKNGWENMKEQAGAIGEGIKNLPGNIKNWASWLVTTKKEEVYVAPDGSYYNGDGYHFNAAGEDLGDTIDLPTLSAWIASGQLSIQKITTQESGFKQLRDSAVQGFKNAGESICQFFGTNSESVKQGMEKIKNKINDMQNKRLELAVDAIRLFDHKEKVWMCMDGTGYYRFDGHSWSKCNMNGDIVAEGVSNETVNALVDSGLVEQTDMKMEGNFREKVSQTYQNIKTSMGNFFSDVASKFNQSIENMKQKVEETKARGRERIVTLGRAFDHKEKVWMLLDGSGYYRFDGNTWSKCSMNGDVLAEGISTEEVEDMIDAGVVQQDTIELEGTLKQKAKAALERIGNCALTLIDTRNKLLKQRDELFDKIGDIGSEFVDKVREKGIWGAIKGEFTKDTKTAWYVADGTGYFVMNSSGSFDFYNMNGDKVDSKSGTPASDIEEMQLQGLLTKGEIIEDSDAKKAIKDIQSAVKDAWGAAKDTVKNGWEKFKSFLGGNGSGNTPTSYIPYANGGYGEFKRPKKDLRVIGGFGPAESEQEPETQNGFAYYAQDDSRWANRPYEGTSPDGATMSNAGCAPTALAMVANQVGTGKNVTPTQVADMASATGYRDETGTNAEFIGFASDAMGLPHSETMNPDAAYIQQQVAAGNPVMLNGVSDNRGAFTDAGHYIVAVGEDANGNILVNDPRGKEYSKAYSANELASGSRAAWSFGGGGNMRKAFGNLRRKARAKIGGYGPTGDWLSIVKNVKALIAAQKPTYNQSGTMAITYNGRVLQMRPDCSGYVTACLKIYGSASNSANFSSRSFLNSSMKLDGFTYGGWPGWDGLQQGDIISRDGHVEIFDRNENGTHYVYSCGSTKSLGSAEPLPTGHKEGYTAVWRPGNVGTGMETVAIPEGSSSGSSILGTTSSALGVVGSVGSIFTQAAGKALTGLLTGNWDTNITLDQSASSTGSSYDSSVAPADVNVTGTNTSEKVWNYLTTHGYSKAAAAGMMGNMYAESGMDPTKLQNGRGPAAGIVQWENYTTKQGRWAAMNNFARSQGKDWTDLGAQLAYVDREMSDSSSGYMPGKGGMSLEEFKTSNDVSKTTMAFRRGFERCKDGPSAHDDRRLGAAQKYYDMYANTTTTNDSSATIDKSTLGTNGGFGEWKRNLKKYNKKNLGGFGPVEQVGGTDGTIVEASDMSAENTQTIREITTNEKTTTIATDTKRLENLMEKAIQVLEAISTNTGKIETLGNTKQSNPNIIVSNTNGGNTVNNVSSAQDTVSNNSRLAMQIAKGL